jgi:putative methyltransferase
MSQKPDLIQISARRIDPSTGREYGPCSGPKRKIYFACIHNPEWPVIPFTYGCLRAHAETHPAVREHYAFSSAFFRRERPEDVLRRIDEPFMFCVSLYVWNFRLSMSYCRAIKEKYPGCIIVAGGPHVPERVGNFFEVHPYIDVLIQGEGEIPFQKLLLALLETPADLGQVKGLVYCQEGTPISTGPGEKLPKEIEVPSPFLLGYFDEMVEELRALGSVNVLWETNRGCPYGCTFCDWGSVTMNKLRQFKLDKVMREIEWFSRNRVDLVFATDANFGIIERDVEIARAIASAKDATGYPLQFRVNYAKNSNDRVFEISRTLSRSELSAGTTLSMQSVDDVVLEAVKRDSIGIDNYQKLKKRYASEGVPTYTDLILGLPGETKKTWFDGLCELLRTGHHDDIRVYPLAILPNAPLNLNGDREKYGLRTVTKKMFKDWDEEWELVCGSATMPTEDWADCRAFSSAVITGLHCGGYTRFLSIYLNDQRALTYREFYTGLFEYSKARPTSVLGRLLKTVRERLLEFADTSNDLQDPTLSEEMKAMLAKYPGSFARGLPACCWLSINEDLDAFHGDLREFVQSIRPDLTADPVVQDLWRFQADMMLRPEYDPKCGKWGRYLIDWSRYFKDGTVAKGPVLVRFGDSAMGTAHQDPLQKGSLGHFARAAVGSHFPYSTHRRFFHQFDRMQVTPEGPEVRAKDLIRVG